MGKGHRAKPQRKKSKPARRQHATRSSGGLQRHPEIEGLLDEYERAAGKAALIELKLRILTDKLPELEGLAHDGKLENVEDGSVDWFEERVTVGAASLLQTSRRLRNKLLHGDLRAARGKLQEAGAPPVRGGARRVTFGEDATGAEMRAQITAVAANEPGSWSFVADDKATADSGVFMWLVELGERTNSWEQRSSSCESAS